MVYLFHYDNITDFVNGVWWTWQQRYSHCFCVYIMLSSTKNNNLSLSIEKNKHFESIYFDGLPSRNTLQ